MAYQIASEQFSGPLDLLLGLIERQEFDITHISLAAVADDYLRYLKAHPDLPPEELADFLVIAAKLIVIKSKALLPNLELDESADSLEAQLKLYREFVTAMETLQGLIDQRQFSYSHDRLPAGLVPPFFPPPSLTSPGLAEAFSRAISRLIPIIALPAQMIKRIINIEEKIKSIREYISRQVSTSFHKLVGGGDKVEKIVNFLALLELMKQHFVILDQSQRFGDITITRHQS